MFETFTDRARQTMRLANQEALRIHQEYVGTEHMLLGILEQGDCAGATVLKNLHVDLPTARSEVEKFLKPGQHPAAYLKVPLTPRAKRVVEHAIYEARSLNSRHVGTEHLLLGLLREPDGIAAQALTALGVPYYEARAALLDLLNKGGS